MMMTLVHALLQPKCSLYSINNEEEYTKRYSVTENQDRGPKTSIVATNNKVAKHVVQASTEVANRKDINHNIHEQHADKSHKIHISTGNDVSKLSKFKTLNEENVIEKPQMKLHESKTHSKQRYKKDTTNSIEPIHLRNMIQLDNLIILLKKKIYLYLISQILKYNHTIETGGNIIIANWKTNTEIYGMLSKYFKFFSTNRKYFITWKILSLIMKDIPVFKEIIWCWSKIDDEYEERTEIVNIKQEGVKIIIHLLNGKLKYDTIGMSGTKVKLNAEIIAEYVEVLDLIKSYKEHRPLPIENNKFNRTILNIDEDIWIRSGEIIANDGKNELWYVTENCAILCKESDDEPNKEMTGHKQRRDVLDCKANVNEIKDDGDDSK
jgi:hypothetical protein